MISFLPRLSAFDPADISEGSLDPLGLAKLAGALGDKLVPGYTERSRRPRFVTALALGARVLDRAKYPEGAYGDHADGPANIAFERLLVESYARRGKAGDPGLIGVPGIGKAREARERNVRLTSNIYLVSPGAVGLWVAYKRLARELKVLDESGHLQENGFELLKAWEEGERLPGRVTGPSNESIDFLEQIDRALEPLLDKVQEKWKPQTIWKFLNEHLEPHGLTRPEARVLRRLIVNGDARRADVFRTLEQWKDRDSLRGLEEAKVLDWLSKHAGPETREIVQAILAYEAVVVLLLRSLECLQYLGSKRPDLRVDAALAIEHAETGSILKAMPARLAAALERAEPLLELVGERAQRDATLGWLHGGAMNSAEALLEALLLRHHDTQRRKPPDGKLPWIEGGARGCFVRVRYLLYELPPERSMFHPYRTRPARETLRDLWEAEK